ncbi:hypothetical protein RB598_009381 [Gaeumannomyces tritici]
MPSQLHARPDAHARWAPYLRPALPPRPSTPPACPPACLSTGPTGPPAACPPSTPPKQRAKELDRDTKIKARALHEYAGFSYTKIAEAMGITRRQAQLACEGAVTPHKAGRVGPHHKKATDEQIRALKEFLHEDPRHRQIPWADLRYLVPGFEDWGRTAMHSLLYSLHYKRMQQGVKLPLSPRVRQLRLRFAHWALERWPTEEHWIQSGVGPFLWSDEVWYFNRPLKGQRYITIHNCEDPATFALVKQKGHGFMFWGSFAGKVKGPTFFWPDKTSIDASEYCRRILPLVFSWLEAQACRPLYFQQDNASSHRARMTRHWLEVLQIITFLWPPNSPDLNPIENLWAWMKKWLENNYNLQQLTSLQLRAAVQAAWEAVPADLLEKMARSMVQRLRMVIANNGDHIDY